MKNVLWAWMMLLLGFWARPVAAQYKGTGQEFFEFQLPSGWKAGYAHETRSTEIIELIRKGDDIHNWKELITFQNVGRTKQSAPTPQASFEAWKNSLDETCPGDVQWNTIQQDEYSITFEWQLTKPCAGAPREAQADVEQHEIQRTVYGKYNIFILQYAAKGPGLAAEARTKWINWLSASVAQIDAEIDQVVPFPADKVIAALRPAMQSFNCEVTKATPTRIECKRPRPNLFLKGSPSGGEKVTAILASQGDQTRVRISTGLGLYGRFNKKNWSYPVFHQMLTNLQNAGS